MFLICCASYAQDIKTYIPTNAKKYAPMLRQQQLKIWPTHAMPEALAGLAEQESCINLKFSSCWNPTTKLDTSRELGAGIDQITKAYNADGSVRFDMLSSLVKEHPQELAGWNWNNVFVRVDLQLASLVLLNQDNYKALYMVKDPVARLHFTDSAFNGGLGGVNNDRRACGLRKGCDPQKWFDNVEKTCTKSTKPIYGTRNACDINREHVKNVFQLRSPKYRVFF